MRMPVEDERFSVFSMRKKGPWREAQRLRIDGIDVGQVRDGLKGETKAEDHLCTSFLRPFVACLLGCLVRNEMQKVACKSHACRTTYVCT